ncbi:hypothetical protein KQI82_01170 [Oscillibacter sp. MSJ-2]|uniref:Opacity-associated protein A-like N-terminal domain-containing protein n=1 Tax=Dysosmobacter acutus TaxID=2841504 RepID=A0ABS6F643_9FIRM|nr:hypothetical protein [Dysosmobacter acutus]
MWGSLPKRHKVLLCVLFGT